MKRVLTILLLLLMATTGDAFAQARHITGRILDERGEGLPGAGITVKGTTTGTVTDVDGNYQLDVPEGSNTLVVQSIGFTTQEVAATEGAIVRLNLSSQELQGAVVTANAVRREKRSLGYATTQVTGNELVAGGSSSPLNALVGKVAGANINTTANAPGTSSRIVLRGGSSIGRNNQALIVVDGVPVNNSNFQTNGNIGQLSNQVDYGNRGNDVNPEDIESISVLKGPAATALYGSIASNGAVMITTKKGRRRTGPSKTDVEVSSSFELSSILKYPEFQNSYGQGNMYDGIYDDRRENFSWGARFDGQMRPWGQIIDGQQKTKPYSALEDNVKNFFQNGRTWNNSVAINGGNEDAAYRLSFGSLNSKSIFKSKDYNKYNVGFNGNANLSNKVFSSINVNYVKIDSDLPSFGQNNASIIDNLYQTPRDIPITELKNLDDKFNSMDYVDEQGIHRYGYYGAYLINPYYTMKNFINENRVDRAYGNIIVGYKPVEWLTIQNRLAIDNYSDRRYQRQPKFSNIPAEDSPLYNSDYAHSNLGLYSEDLYNVNNLYNDLMAIGSKDLNDDFNLNFTLGNNIFQNRTNNTFATTNEEGGLVIPGFYNLGNSNGQVQSTNELSITRRYSFYGDATVGYKNMLFLGLTGRNDWSSTIKKSYFYYGANASFVFSELFQASLKDKIWNYGKLRLSYGSVGNDASAYQDRTYYGKAEPQGGFGSTQFPFNSNIPGFSYGNVLGNNNIQPEFSQEVEGGVELAFFRSRLTADISLYNKRSTNQIVTNPISPSAGYTFQVINTGLMTNKGIEIALRGTPVQTATGFKWELFGTFTKNTNQVKEIFPGTDQVVVGGYTGMSIVAAVGRPYGTFYTTGHVFAPDGRIVVDSTGIPIVSTTAQYYGSYLPKWQASWGTALSYKGFSLNVLFDMKKGGVFFSRTRDVLSFVGTSKETENREDQVWENSVQQLDDGTYVTNTTPYSPYKYFTSAGLRPESENLVDASYVKLREARLTYLFPKRWLDRTFIGSASVSIYGNNLFLWTQDENKYVDPEVNSAGSGNAQGFDFSAYPSLRNYGVNLRFTF